MEDEKYVSVIYVKFKSCKKNQSFISILIFFPHFQMSTFSNMRRKYCDTDRHGSCHISSTKEFFFALLNVYAVFYVPVLIYHMPITLQNLYSINV